MMRPQFGYLFFALWAGGACGCGGERLHPVEGFVLFEGKPVVGAAVTFMPLGERGSSATAVTDHNGFFQLTTYHDADGAVAGSYKVTIAKTVSNVSNDDGEEPAFAPAYEAYMSGKLPFRSGTLLPPHYADLWRTPLRCRVPAEKTVTVDLRMPPQPKKKQQEDAELKKWRTGKLTPTP